MCAARAVFAGSDSMHLMCLSEAGRALSASIRVRLPMLDREAVAGPGGLPSETSASAASGSAGAKRAATAAGSGGPPVPSPTLRPGRDAPSTCSLPKRGDELGDGKAGAVEGRDAKGDDAGSAPAVRAHCCYKIGWTRNTRRSECLPGPTDPGCDFGLRWL